MIRFNRIARQELASQLAFIAAASPAAALGIARTIRETLAMLDGGVDGVEVMLMSGRRVRRWPVHPLLIFYDRRGKILTVLRVRHGAQRSLV